MRRVALVRFVVLASLGTVLVACTGGGGGHSASPPPSGSRSVPVLAATVTPDMATAMVSAARAISALTTYDYRHLDASHANAVRYLAEPLRSKYESSWTTQVLPQATKVHTVVEGKTTDVAVTEIDGAKIGILAFGQQNVSNSSRQPGVDLVTVAATMSRSGGKWLLSELDSVATDTPLRTSTTWASPDLAAAILAGTQCATKFTSLDGRHFDTDFQAQLDCTTGQLHTDLGTKRGELRTAAAKATAVGQVSQVGVTAVTADKVSLLMAVSVTSTTSPGAPPAKRLNNLIVTLQQVSGRWLASNLSTPDAQ